MCLALCDLKGEGLVGEDGVAAVRGARVGHQGEGGENSLGNNCTVIVDTY